MHIYIKIFVYIRFFLSLQTYILVQHALDNPSFRSFRYTTRCACRLSSATNRQAFSAKDIKDNKSPGFVFCDLCSTYVWYIVWSQSCLHSPSGNSRIPPSLRLTCHPQASPVRSRQFTQRWPQFERLAARFCWL